VHRNAQGLCLEIIDGSHPQHLGRACDRDRESGLEQVVEHWCLQILGTETRHEMRRQKDAFKSKRLFVD
jgi:hypothetical protein